MLPGNKRHLRRAALWSAAAAAVLAGTSLVWFPPLVGASVLAGAVLGLFNLFSIVRLVEALTGAAQAGRAFGKASRALAGFVHVFKLGAIFAALFLLVYLKMVNLPALLVGFTLVLVMNVLAGMAGLKEGDN